ncbi:NAD-dependent epimerase/dehydratase family protein [Pseudomonas abietaniphila]|uniref:dTDP-glucose 4,6-dehydratase/UDP-glucose 4-epimerase n=1 Tax=Pseudomonas abietaniphila TaxID=89065 RepID=A0A1G8BT88_9PSED|nr:NAD-dependent epimerase/dehydratase family protein [Pseudomonas abietaniphila]SDH36293.1 dTDP-glucose 4,6-dehydratase/UDP-glucose 4-epimerase [Pseudomonas abietaniphila]
MKILIMGSNGFIGHHLVRKFGLLGHEVVRADINKLADRECLVFNPHNPDFMSLFELVQPDVCVNCTGAASVPASFDDPLYDYTLNTVRVAQMLEAIRAKAPHSRYVHFSSAAVYGNPFSSPVSEVAALNPVSPYGWHKQYAEQLCREYHELHQLKTISLRVFSAYGPGLKKQIFWDVFQKALTNQNIELFGTGQETRDFVYVEDIASSIDVLLREGAFDGRAINVASGTASTISEAAHHLIGALGFHKDIKFSGTERLGDPTHWQADISYLSSLGFQPEFDLQLGLERVASWMKNL